MSQTTKVSSSSCICSSCVKLYRVQRRRMSRLEDKNNKLWLHSFLFFCKRHAKIFSSIYRRRRIVRRSSKESMQKGKNDKGKSSVCRIVAVIQVCAVSCITCLAIHTPNFNVYESIVLLEMYFVFRIIIVVLMLAGKKSRERTSRLVSFQR